MLMLGIIGTAVLWWLCVRLKRVRMDDQSLYISSYWNEIVVPLRDVSDVTQDFWGSYPRVFIRFHHTNLFGASISFMPRTQWFDFGPPAVIEELENAIRRAGGFGLQGHRKHEGRGAIPM
jgi:hypothetical protein